MKYALKLTRAIAIDGAIRRAGSVVEVDEGLARDLLRRGKAELAEMPPASEDAEPEIDLSKMSKVQLVGVADGLGIEVTAAMTKPELLDAIQKYQET